MVLPKQTSTTIIMSPGMTSAIFQESLMAHILELKSKALNVITSGQAGASTKTVQKHLFFIDDLNTASKKEGLLRTYVHVHFYKSSVNLTSANLVWRRVS